MQRALPHAAPRSPAAGGGREGTGSGAGNQGWGRGGDPQPLPTLGGPRGSLPGKERRVGGADHLAPFEVSLAVVSFCKVREWEQEHGVRSGDPMPHSLQPRVGAVTAVTPGCRPSHSRLVICPSKR